MLHNIYKQSRTMPIAIIPRMPVLPGGSLTCDLHACLRHRSCRVNIRMWSGAVLLLVISLDHACRDTGKLFPKMAISHQKKGGRYHLTSHLAVLLQTNQS